MKKTVKQRAAVVNESISCNSTLSSSGYPNSNDFNAAEDCKRPGHKSEKLQCQHKPAFWFSRDAKPNFGDFVVRLERSAYAGKLLGNLIHVQG
jgi:hypothetical protein